MKTLIEYKRKTIKEHYAEIRRIFTNWGATVVSITHTFDDTCDPSTGFVITLKGRRTSMLEELVDKAMTCYCYSIKWVS